jgi:hypothetical protein
MLNRYLIVMFSALIGGCEPEQSKSPTEKLVDEFRDDAYTCEVLNTATMNGPYSLTCEKAGHTVTVHFPNGGYISGALVGASKNMLEFSATDSRSNEWRITISR